MDSAHGRAIVPSRFPWLQLDRYAFSPGMTIPGGAVLSGQTAAEYDADIKRIVVKGGLARQARTAYAKMQAILAAGGFRPTDVAHMTEYLPSASMPNRDSLHSIRKDVFGYHEPTISTIFVDRLLRSEALVEVEGWIAAGDDGDHKGKETRALEASQVGDMVFLPSVTPLDAPGWTDAPKGVYAQRDIVYDVATEKLRIAGLGWNDVVRRTEYWSAAAIEESLPTIEAGRVPEGRVVVEALSEPEVAINLEICASTAPVYVVDAPVDPGGQVGAASLVRAGRLLVGSGIHAWDDVHNRVRFPGDVVAQARLIYEALQAIPAAAARKSARLVHTVEYVARQGLAAYKDTAALRRSILDHPLPASTGVVCKAFSRPGCLIEVIALWSLQ